VEDKDKYAYIKTTEETFPVLNILSILRQIHKFMETSYLMQLVTPSAKDKTGVGKITGIAQKKVAERFGPNKKENHDMLGSFIRHGLTQEEAESESVLQMSVKNGLLAAQSSRSNTSLMLTSLHAVLPVPTQLLPQSAALSST